MLAFVERATTTRHIAAAMMLLLIAHLTATTIATEEGVKEFFSATSVRRLTATESFAVTSLGENRRALRIKAMGHEAEFHMTRTESIFAEDAKIEVLESGNTKRYLSASEFPSRSFAVGVSEEQSNWGLLIEQPDGTLRGIVTLFEGNRMFQFGHVNTFESEMPEDRFRLLKESAKDGYVIHEVSDIVGLDVPGGLDDAPPCGAQDSDAKPSKFPGTKTNGVEGSGLVSSADIPLVTVPYGKVQPWYPGCFDTDSIKRDFEIGIAADYSYFMAAGSVRDAINDAENLVSLTRMLYLQQFHVGLKIGKITVTTSGDAPFPLNMGSPDVPCIRDSSMIINKFMNWNNDHNGGESRQGIWHMLTNCWPPPGTVGIAQIGALCDFPSNVGVSTRVGTGSTSWYIFAHEVGHNFGARHSFEYGMGKTGGIMDYGNVNYNGVPQFHPLKRPEVCAEIASALARKCPYFTVIGGDGSSCGNGVLEKGEECECLDNGSTSCGVCSNCKLQRAVQCSTKDFVMRTRTSQMSDDLIPANSLQLSQTQCCSSSGAMYGPTTSCNGGADVCIQGQCTKLCSKWSLYNCGMTNGGCRQSCSYSLGGACDDNIRTQSTNKPISWVPDGTPCNNGRGECSNGECTSGGNVSPTPKPTTTAPPPPPPPEDPGCPSAAALAKCGVTIKSKKACKKNRGICSWCGKSCMPGKNKAICSDPTLYSACKLERVKPRLVAPEGVDVIDLARPAIAEQLVLSRVTEYEKSEEEEDASEYDDPASFEPSPENQPPRSAPPCPWGRLEKCAALTRHTCIKTAYGKQACQFCAGSCGPRSPGGCLDPLDYYAHCKRL